LNDAVLIQNVRRRWIERQCKRTGSANSAKYEFVCTNGVARQAIYV